MYQKIKQCTFKGNPYIKDDAPSKDGASELCGILPYHSNLIVLGMIQFTNIIHIFSGLSTKN